MEVIVDSWVTKRVGKYLRNYLGKMEYKLNMNESLLLNQVLVGNLKGKL